MLLCRNNKASTFSGLMLHLVFDICAVLFSHLTHLCTYLGVYAGVTCSIFQVLISPKSLLA